MRIAPIDITHKTFGRKLMGLDPDEVTEFMRRVAEDMEAIIRERNSLRESLREKEMIVADYRERDELLKSTITTATKMSDKIQTDAEREAKLIIHDAQQRADMIVHDARDSLRKIYQEITDLKRLRMQFENNLKALVQSHLTMIDQGQKIMPNPNLDPAPVTTVAANPSSAQPSQAATQTQARASDVQDAQAIKARVSEVVQSKLANRSLDF